MKDIDGYEGLYSITEDGRVWSHAKSGSGGHNGKFLRLTKSPFGYITASLNHKNFFVHRLIALAYLPNPENKPFINHKNGIRDDNRLENLEWCTQSENCLHGFRVNGRKLSKHHIDTAIKNFGLKYCRKVQQFTKDGLFVAEFESTHDAQKITGIANQLISQCARGETKHSHGFVWKYV